MLRQGKEISLFGSKVLALAPQREETAVLLVAI